MSDRQDTTADQEEKIRRELNHADEAFIDYKNRYQLGAAKASAGEDPMADFDVLSAKIRLHNRTMYVYRLLRPYIRIYLDPGYWRDAELYKTHDGSIMVRGLRQLDRLQDRVVMTNREESRTHSEDVQKEEYNVDLMPDEFYKRTVEMLREAAARLNIISLPNGPNKVYDLNWSEDDQLPNTLPESERVQSADADDSPKEAVADGGGADD